MTTLNVQNTKTINFSSTIYDTDFIHIVFCIDNNYAQHLGATITSIIINNSEQSFYFHIICDNLDISNMDKFKELYIRYRRHIKLYFIDNKLFRTFKVSKHASPANYFRLLIPYVISEKIQKILYLDADVIVTNNLKSLWNTSIENKPIAACTVNNEERINTLQLVSKAYFGSGVMLINTNYWRKHNVSIEAIKFIENNFNLIELWDQDALNKVIDGNFVVLDKKWNTNIFLCSNSNPCIDRAHICHFVGSLKPWNKCYDRRKKIYWDYIAQSPWLDTYHERELTLEESVSQSTSKLTYSLISKIRDIYYLLNRFF